LSIILGRAYHETRDAYESLEKNRQQYQSNNGIFSLIYNLGCRVQNEHISKDNTLVVYFTPSLMKIIGHHRYGKVWAADLKARLFELGLENRPLHIVSANLHSVVNLLYGYAAVNGEGLSPKNRELYRFLSGLRHKKDEVVAYAEAHGLLNIPDRSGANIHCQMIDTSLLDKVELHPDLACCHLPGEENLRPVILVMDYAFGAQAFELMENLLRPVSLNGETSFLNVGSISIMGKAGILAGETGDIMLATAHVCEGTSDNYIVENGLTAQDFNGDIPVYTGSMATVFGTSLQNRDMLQMFQLDWKAVGLEMEGAHYQKAISAAIIKGFIPGDTKTMYAYYASDNPLKTGNTLAAGPMGEDGIRPTYMITKVILEKILGS
jgi:hypothetical protein